MGRSLDEALTEASSDELVIDFSGATEGNFDAMVGDFPASVESATPGTVKNGPNAGKPKLEIRFKLDNGAVRTKHCPLHGDTGITKGVLKALGLTIEGDNFRLKPASLVGKRAVLVMGTQKDDTTRDEIKRVKPLVESGSRLG